MDDRGDGKWDGNNMVSGNTDEYDDLFGIHKGVDDLSCIEVRRFGDNCSLCLGFLLIIEDRCYIWVRGISIIVKTRFWNGDYATTMDIAKKQVEDGAYLIDIKVDGMLDGILAMQKFVKIVITEPEVSKSPFMLYESKFEIVMAGLKWCQGKEIMNSISLKVGRRKIQRTGFVIEEA